MAQFERDDQEMLDDLDRGGEDNISPREFAELKAAVERRGQLIEQLRQMVEGMGQAARPNKEEASPPEVPTAAAGVQVSEQAAAGLPAAVEVGKTQSRPYHPTQIAPPSAHDTQAYLPEMLGNDPPPGEPAQMEPARTLPDTTPEAPGPTRVETPRPPAKPPAPTALAEAASSGKSGYFGDSPFTGWSPPFEGFVGPPEAFMPPRKKPPADPEATAPSILADAAGEAVPAFLTGGAGKPDDFAPGSGPPSPYSDDATPAFATGDPAAPPAISTTRPLPGLSPTMPRLANEPGGGTRGAPSHEIIDAFGTAALSKLKEVFNSPRTSGSPAAGGTAGLPGLPGSMLSATAAQAGKPSALADVTGGLGDVLGGLVGLAKGLADLTAASAGLLSTWNAAKVAMAGLATDALAGLKDAVSGAAGSIREGLGALGGTRVGQALGNVGGSIASVAGEVGKVFGPWLNRLSATGKSVGKALGKTVGGIGKAARGAGRLGGGALRGIGKTAKVGAKVAGVAAGAVAAPIAAIGGMAAAASKFVEAVNPSLMMVFGQALRDLTAVVGTALTPVIEVASNVARDFAAALLPVMEQLRPVIAQVSSALAEIAGTAVNVFASTLSALTPVFKVLADVLVAVTPLIQGSFAMIAGVVSAISGLVSGLLSAFGVEMKDVTDGLKSGFQQLSSMVLQATGYLAKFVDGLIGTSILKDFTSGVRKALAGEGVEKKDATGLAAPKNVTTGDLSSFSSQIAQAAFIAGSGAQTKEEADRSWQQGVLKQLENIASGKETELSKTLKSIDEKLGQLIKNTTDSVYKGAAEGGDAVKRFIKAAITKNPMEFFSP